MMLQDRDLQILGNNNKIDPVALIEIQLVCEYITSYRATCRFTLVASKISSAKSFFTPTTERKHNRF